MRSAAERFRHYSIPDLRSHRGTGSLRRVDPLQFGRAREGQKIVREYLRISTFQGNAYSDRCFQPDDVALLRKDLLGLDAELFDLPLSQFVTLSEGFDMPVQVRRGQHATSNILIKVNFGYPTEHSSIDYLPPKTGFHEASCACTPTKRQYKKCPRVESNHCLKIFNLLLSPLSYRSFPIQRGYGMSIGKSPEMLKMRMKDPTLEMPLVGEKDDRVGFRIEAPNNL